MPERTELLIELVKEILGPRSGPQEVLPAAESPRDEYIAGILAPRAAPVLPDSVDEDVDDVAEEVYSEEDEPEGANQPVAHSTVAPALDPKALPRSIGISFCIKGAEQGAHFEACCTWARYAAHASGGWQRRADFLLTGPVSANADHSWAKENVSLQQRVSQVAPNTWRVSLFLVNATPVADDHPLEIPDFVFQPQIRVKLLPGVELLPVRTRSVARVDVPVAGSLAAEDAAMSLLYADQAAFARGHLCGAVWRSIDPERPLNGAAPPPQAPFAWTDAGAVPPNEAPKFQQADLRSDFVPIYSVQNPDMNWPADAGITPELDPVVLSELWEPEAIRQSLSPLANGYRAWIDAQDAATATWGETARSIVKQHLAECRQAADRITAGIALVASDEEVRLAFCFANKAMAIQSQWANAQRGRAGQHLTWRPFQLAFILLNVEAVANPTSARRNVCDLLWFPTGGGKTEAYLGLAAFTMAIRRRRGYGEAHQGGGTAVLSRYTLRLLTIQQFRRALGLVTACEVLRVEGLSAGFGSPGWRPRACNHHDEFIWGTCRFALGLWVGGGVTPNDLHSVTVPTPRGRFKRFVGAIEILQGAERNYNGPNAALRQALQNVEPVIEGEPAQVMSCPCCGSHLAVSDEGFRSGQHTLHFVYQQNSPRTPTVAGLTPPNALFTVDVATSKPVGGNHHVLTLTFTVPDGGKVTAKHIDEWWEHTASPALGTGAMIASARPARPGYFVMHYLNSQGRLCPCEFELLCPNPACGLNGPAWAEQVPVARASNNAPRGGRLEWQQPPAWCGATTRDVWNRIPIPALTVDDQIYHRCPSFVIGTVDKFARLAYEPEAASLFGNVEFYHARWGYYRAGSPPLTGLPQAAQQHPPGHARGSPLHAAVDRLPAPDLVIQDELHLIEGPLGSMVGLYETAIDALASVVVNGQAVRPKYVASTATVRQAGPQVQALFNRQLAQFPPSAVRAGSRFFARDRGTDSHPLDETHPGRLYVGVCAPGKGAQTPIVRIWSALLQTSYALLRTRSPRQVDPYYTLVGYFNAVRELAGALSLYRQDIDERLRYKHGPSARPLPADRHLELSGRAPSLDLPAMLEQLKITAPRALDAVFSTSMFGTGVDVDRLGMMVVHGQPKTTASYIQATGRVGRQIGGLVVTFLRASRPRDLDHYEFFTGYHRAIYRYVEPVTVAPFSPRARERALGPLAAALLRQADAIGGLAVNPDWRIQQRLAGSLFFSAAPRMAAHRHDPEVEQLPPLFEARAQQQPDGRRPPPDVTRIEMEAELDRWAQLAHNHNNPNECVYNEPALLRTPTRHVVLGDAQHRAQGLDQAYPFAPSSLRDIEETTGFKS